jgi:carboxypeptidase T
MRGPIMLMSRHTHLVSAIAGILSCVLLCAAVSADRGDVVLRVDTPTWEQRCAIANAGIDIWTSDPVAGIMEIRVTPAQRAWLDQAGYHYSVLYDDLDALARQSSIPTGGPQPAGLFDNYLTYDATIAYLQTLAAEHPDIAQYYDLGATWDGHRVAALKISDNVTESELAEPAVLFDGLQHAREWIALMVPLYIADWLVSNYETDYQARRLVDNLEIWVVPMVNPDGYEFSRTNDRYWRKNRRDNGGGIYGVDLNRNWGRWWGEAGASHSPSSPTYCGPSAFSEPETQILRDLILSRSNLRAMIDFHSYGEYIVYPWGHIPDSPPDEGLYIQLGGEIQQKIHDTHGHSYQLFQGYDDYQTSGEIIDWVYGDAGLIIYTIELRPRGSPGFILPPSEIIPTCEEILPAALHVTRWVGLAQAQAPTGLIDPGWNWLSIPAWPDNADPAALFGAANVVNKLMRYDRVRKTIQLYPDDFGTMAVGEGYALFAQHILAPAFEGVATGGDFRADLPAMGWSWIGHPHLESVPLAQVSVTNTANGRTRTAVEDAHAANPWVNWNWIFWDSARDTARILGLADSDDDTLRPWRGYLVWTRRDGLVLTIPAPTQ